MEIIIKGINENVKVDVNEVHLPVGVVYYGILNLHQLRMLGYGNKNVIIKKGMVLIQDEDPIVYVYDYDDNYVDSFSCELIND